jgi:hypothetical protein
MRRFLIGLTIVAAGSAVALPARASYPGKVSRLAFGSSGTSGNIDIYTARPNGAARERPRSGGACRGGRRAAPA